MYVEKLDVYEYITLCFNERKPKYVFYITHLLEFLYSSVENIIF